ncbi:hypothetical protein [Absidia glauca]|uniref:Senescence domain-containing protein n=1 Tax=Absidia glauca TaxID=4829 RepID=A0A163JA72_ABSGL|nr:hypothetical protein [Absidia glauca]
MATALMERYDPSPLTFLCTIHHVTISAITDLNQIQLVGEQFTIEVYVTTSESLLLQCYPVSTTSSPTAPTDEHLNLPEMTITIASQSKACLGPPSTLTVPRAEGGHWSLDCSATDPQEFMTLQDMLTHFIKFENQRQIRNTLAMVDPASYQVTHLIAENVYLDPNKKQEADQEDDEDSLLADDDFIATRENYYGQKLPVTMDENIFEGGLQLRKVRLIYQTAQCIEVGSDWLARGLVSAGDSLANYIQSGSRSVQENVETTVNTHLVVSSKERQYFDMAYNLTSTAGNMAGSWLSRLLNLPAVKQASSDLRIPTPQTQLGNSALQAATRVIEGSVVAGRTVFTASREGLVQMIEKKYGPDAGYMAERLIGTSKPGGGDVMVYFDDQGISRRVVMQQPPHTVSSSFPVTPARNNVNIQPSTSVLVYEDNDSDWGDNHRQVVYDTDDLGQACDKKKQSTFVYV